MKIGNLPFGISILLLVSVVSLPPSYGADRPQKPLLGIYYFDGWADSSPANFHLQGLTGSYADREPLSGWYDNSAALVHQQTVWARKAELNFYIFDWYDTSRDSNQSDKTLNSALRFFIQDRHKMGMKYSLLYVNNGSFSVPQDKWDAQCKDWVDTYFKDKNYQRVDGKPLLVTFSVGDMDKTWGSPQNVAQAWERLQQTAHNAGLPGVYLVACALPGPRNGWNDLNRLVQEGYDAFSGYNYPGMAGTVKGSNPYSIILNGSKVIFDDFATDGRKPYIPDIMTGWDSRPWKETDYWYERTPDQFGQMVTEGLDWWRDNPTVRAIQNRPLLFVEAWNELGEGSYIMPTKGDGFQYLDALKSAVENWVHLNPGAK